MKRKIILALAAVVSCMSVGAYGSYAYFTSEIRTENVITVGNLKIDLIETSLPGEEGRMTSEGEWNGVMPGGSVSRTVQVENTGDHPAYVRIRVNKRISLAEGKGEEADSGLVTCDLNQEDWIDGKDGYYYYRDSLEAGRRTEPLFERVMFDASMGDRYQNSVVRLEIQAQATQVVHNGTNVMEAGGWPTDGQ